MIPVIDAHHHIWRQDDLPWLKGPMVPRIFGPYEPLRRDYPIDEYLADIAGTGVEKSVYVQANWPPEKAEDEVAWVQKTGRRERLAARHRRLRRPDGRRRAPGARPADAVSAAPRHPHAASLARERAVPLRRAARPRRRPDVPPEFRGARRSRLLLRSAGLRRPDGGRGAARRRFPRDHVRPAARRHAGGPVGGGEDGLAARDARACDAAERLLQALRARHLHPQERPGAYRVDRAGDGGALRRGSLPLRLELPDREAVDRPIRRCSMPIARRSPAYGSRAARDPSRHGGTGLQTRLEFACALGPIEKARA